MLNQSKTLIINDNIINRPCMLLLLGIILLILLITYIVSIELNRKRILELEKFKCEIQFEKLKKQKQTAFEKEGKNEKYERL